MKRYQPITAAEPIGKRLALKITWKDKTVSAVNLTAIIESTRALAPLAERELFKSARASDDGFAVEWTDDLDLGAMQLWRWAGEQAGELMPTEDFRRWRERHALSLSTAATALGLSRRTVAYYESGREPIPKTVLLATIGYDAREAA